MIIVSRVIKRNFFFVPFTAKHENVRHWFRH